MKFLSKRWKKSKTKEGENQRRFNNILEFFKINNIYLFHFYQFIKIYCTISREAKRKIHVETRIVFSQQYKKALPVACSDSKN